MTYKDLLKVLTCYANQNSDFLNQKVSLELEENEFYEIETIYEAGEGSKLSLTVELTKEVENRLRQL